MSRPFVDLSRGVRAAMSALPDCCDRDGFTYLIAGGDMIKIGFSTDPSARIVSLQTGSPILLSLVALARGDHEGYLHTRCSPHRAHGEWFSAEGVLQELKTDLETSGRFRLCLGCASHLTPEMVQRLTIEATAPTIVLRPCESDDYCRPIAWYTADGQVCTTYYGDLRCKRTLRTIENTGRLTPEMISTFDDKYPLPTRDMDELREWRAGCLRCAVRSGEVKKTHEVAMVLARFLYGGETDDLSKWCKAVALGEVSA